MAHNWDTRNKPSPTTTFLLKEDGDYILQENEDKIILTIGDGNWDTRTKPVIT